MRAITIKNAKGDADALEISQIAEPDLRPHEILIDVYAAGVNRPDIIQRNGFYPAPPGAPETLGLEAAGIVSALGNEVSKWQVGDRVMALLPGGGYAEKVCVNCAHVLPIPNDISFAQAAAMPETIFTVWTNVFERAALKSGETLLVHGANSGIGATAIQMGKAAGARVFATARGTEKAAFATTLGADLAIDASSEDWVNLVKENGGADVILDFIGATYFDGNISALNTDGRLSIIATLSGADVSVNLMKLMLKRQTITASTLRSRSDANKAELTAAINTHVLPWIESGRVAPPVDQTYPLEDAANAHKRLEAGEQCGKVVLIVRS